MKIIRKIAFLCIVLMLCIVNITYGFGVGDITGTTISNSDATALKDEIIEVISTIGAILSVLILIVIGIKYMVGSIEEKANYKKTLLPYVIGCILLFATSTIVGVVHEIAHL